MAFKRIIAVDFDNTLSLDNHWPYIGEPNLPLISFLHDAQVKGYGIVLWTCREGQLLDEAVAWCKKLGLEFDAINENPDYVGWKSRKVVADMYIDDRAFNLEDYKQYIL